MSESDHLNSTNNTGNTFISLDQASTIMADQTQGANPQHVIEYLLLHYYTNKESLTLTNKSYTKKSVCYLSGDHLNNVVDPLNKVSI